MKTFKLTLFLIGAALSFGACADQNDTASEPTESIAVQKEEIYDSAGSMDEHYLRLVERTEPTWAGISYASHTGSVSSDYIAEIEDTESLQFIVDEMIEGSNREPGVVDMTQPYYDMKIEYADGSEEVFHLWVTEDDLTGTIMDSEDTHFIYTFSDEVSERFLSFIPDDQILDSPETAEWIDGNTFGLTQDLHPSLEESIEQLISYNSYILQGRYTSAEPSEVPESWGDESMVYYTFEVTDVLKGDLDMDEIEVGQPDNVLTWVRDPETGQDLGMIQSKDPFFAKPDPDKEVILFLSMQNEPGEFWRFSEPTMVEVLDDGSLKSLSPVFDADFDTSDCIEQHDLENGWEVELTLDIQSESLPADDLFESVTYEEFLDRIN